MGNLQITKVLPVVASFVTCVCYQENKFSKEPSFSEKICTEDEVRFQARTRSLISCGGLCTVDAGCQSIVYHNGNKLCYGITPAISCHTFLDLPGAAFYRLFPLPTTTSTTTTTTTTPTPVLGCSSSQALLPGVSNSQLIATSTWTSHYPPSGARLDANSYWAAKTDSISEYIQVDFHSIRVVTHVILQGACCDNEFVHSYKLLTSTDCSTFQTVTDENNNHKVFPGTNDRNTHITSSLDPAIAARCFRINPITYSWPSLRFELLGCMP